MGNKSRFIGCNQTLPYLVLIFYLTIVWAFLED